ncbi:uncharacterized protein LOC142612272 [Castanea sativa]|uniref:uncharacterized protein LOC142612272 n=1 Tax=Castanea sativa TaxID=21020 RepID=UPI003F64F239
MTDLMNQSQHIQKVLENFNSDQIASNQLRLKASINIVKVLAFQGLAFRGRDEGSNSINHGNFLEILDLVVSYNEYVAKAIEKAPKNAFYKSPKIQKEILHVFSNKVKKAIREEIGDAKFCLIVDEAHDESMKEQMAMVIRFIFKIFEGKDTMVQAICEITNALCQALQCQSQDILNLMNFVSSTKALIQKFRDEELDNLLTTVKSFCEVHDRDVLDMNACYVERGGLTRYQQDDFTIEHHYRVDIFYAAIDSILQELNHWFSKHAVELLNLSSTLDPKEARESFRSIDILLLVSKFYPKDFTDQKMTLLKVEVDHYEHNVVRHPDFKKLSSIFELCQWLVKTQKSLFYPYIYKVITLVLTLLVSTATTERTFSAMNIIKNRLCNKMEDDFIMDSMILYIKKEIAAKFGTESIIDYFRDLKEH